MPELSFILEQAKRGDAAEIAVLRTDAARRLRQRFGEGRWSTEIGEHTVLYGMARGRVMVGRIDQRIAVTLQLTRSTPRNVDESMFKRANRPLYLLAMAVAPELQGLGVGRRAMAEAERIAHEQKTQAIRLDAHDAPAGAGGFYLACGYREAGRGRYNDAPLIFFERLL